MAYVYGKPLPVKGPAFLGTWRFLHFGYLKLFGVKNDPQQAPRQGTWQRLGA